MKISHNVLPKAIAVFAGMFFGVGTSHADEWYCKREDVRLIIFQEGVAYLEKGIVQISMPCKRENDGSLYCGTTTAENSEIVGANMFVLYFDPQTGKPASLTYINVEDDFFTAELETLDDWTCALQD